MSAKPKAKLQRLSSLKIRRVDLVDRGDNPLADVELYKRKGGDGMTCPSCGASAPEGAKTCPECGKGMSAAKLMKYSSDPKTVGEVLQSREVSDELWKLQSAFNTSLDSIMCSDLDANGRAAAITKSVEEFLAALKVLVAGAAVVAGVTAPEIVSAETVSDMAKRARDEAARIVKEASMSKPAALDLALIPDGQKPAVEELKKRADAATAAEAEVKTAKERVTALEAEVEALKKRIPAEEPPVPAEVVELRKKVAALEDEGETVRFEKIARDLNIAGTTPEKFAPILKRVHKGCTTKEDAAEIERLLKSASELARQSDVFKARGFDGDSKEDPSAVGDAAYEVAKARAQGLLKEGKAKTESEAMDLVWKTDKDLWNRYRAGNRVSAN